MTPSPATLPYFSVVIPTFNRVSMLVRVLESLKGQEEAPPFEVIVVDDGSSDETAAVMRQQVADPKGSVPFRFHSQRNSGPGAARNRGVEDARGKFVVFIGDDTVPESRFLAEHAAVHAASDDDPLVACLGYTGWPTDVRISSFMHYINSYGLSSATS